MTRGRPMRTTHGEYGYARRRHCDCEPCLEAVRRYNRFLVYDKLRGITRRQDATAVREHILQLEELGLRRHQIATAAGLSHTVLDNIVGDRGGEPAKYVLRPTREKILATTPDQAFDVPTMLPSIGVRRRIWALEWMGHAKSRIAVELGVSTSQMYNYMEAENVYAKTVQAVHDVYERLRDEPGTSAYAMWGARREGRHPWMAWDDETIDDPDAEPGSVRCLITNCGRASTRANLCRHHYGEVKAMGGFKEPRRYPPVVRKISLASVTTGSKREHVIELLKAGGSQARQGLMDVDIATRVGCTKEYVRKIRAGER